MDFSFSDDQIELRALAARILTDRCSPAALKQFASSGHAFDTRAWGDLYDAGLCSLHLPENVGGAGLGFVELAIVLEEVGRRVAPVPLWGHSIATWAVARFGDGERVAAVDAAAPWALGLHEALGDPHTPSTAASQTAGGWKLDGGKDFVWDAAGASTIVVSARLDDGSLALVEVDPGAPGVALAPLTTPTGYSRSQVRFSGVEVGADRMTRLTPAEFDLVLQHAIVGLCSLGVGALEEALRLTADYAKERQQFDKPIGTFQAVAQRAADAHIDTEAVRLTSRHAAWRLDTGRDCRSETAVAKYWLSEGGARVMLAAHHLHGGVGVDRDYPLPRYFFLMKELELLLGGATLQLRELGRVLAGAATPA